MHGRRRRGARAARCRALAAHVYDRAPEQVPVAGRRGEARVRRPARGRRAGPLRQVSGQLRALVRGRRGGVDALRVLQAEPAGDRRAQQPEPVRALRHHQVQRLLGPRAQGDEDEQGRHHLVPQDEGDTQDAVPRAHQPGARRRLRERRRERAAPAPGRRARRLGRDERERRRRRARHRRHGAGRRDRRQALRLDEPDRVQDGPPRGRQLDAGHGRLGDERRLRGVHALPAARELRHRLGLRRQL